MWNAAIIDMKALASHMRANMATTRSPWSDRPFHNSMSSQFADSHNLENAQCSAAPAQRQRLALPPISIRPSPTSAQSKSSLRSGLSLLGDDSLVLDAPALPDGANPELLKHHLPNLSLATRDQGYLIDPGQDFWWNDGHIPGGEDAQATPLLKHSSPSTSTPNTSKSTINSHGGPLTPPPTQRSFHAEENQLPAKAAMHRLDGASHSLHDPTSRWWPASRTSLELGPRTSLEVRSPRNTQTPSRASLEVQPQALRRTLRPGLLSRRSEDLGECRDWGSTFPLRSKSTSQRGDLVRKSVNSSSVRPAPHVLSSNLSPALERYELEEEEDLNDLLNLLMTASRDFYNQRAQPPALQRLDFFLLDPSKSHEEQIDRLRPTSKVTPPT